MRAAIGLFSVVLFLIAIVCIALGVYVFSLGIGHATAPGSGSGFVAAIGISYPLFLLGTIALGSLAVVLAIEDARAQQVIAIHRIGSDVAYEARREPDDPALRAKRARMAAEAEARIETARERIEPKG